MRLNLLGLVKQYKHKKIIILLKNMKIMPEVFILGCIYAPPAHKDLMRAEGPKHIPIF